jgi:Predicted alternative thymidylate synthase
MHATNASEWRLQSSGNRQGSAGMVDEAIGGILTERERALHVFARDVYDERLKYGVAREQARKDLPLSTYTEAFWKIDLHNLLHFLELRMQPAAQFEIRAYAKTIGELIVAKWVPSVWDAFREYRLDSVVLSAREQALVQCAIANGTAAARRLAKDLGWLRYEGSRVVPAREWHECVEKASRLGVVLDAVVGAENSSSDD